MFEEAETPWQQSRWALIFMLVGANPPAGTQAILGDMKRFLALPGWDVGMSTVDFFFDLFTEKPREEKKDTFVEKLATQVIKNLQVKISSIHIRYEDDVSIDKTQVSSFRFKSQWSLGESY